MLQSSRWLFSTGRSVVGLVRESQVSFLAAATAFYAFVSVFPLLLLVLALGSVFGGEMLAERVVATVSNALSPSGQSLLRDAITSDAGRGGATVVGVTGLLWSGLRVFRGLDLAFAAIYGTSEREGLLEQIRDAGVALGALGVGVLAVVVGNLLLSRTGVPMGGVPDTIGLVIALTVGLVPLYYVLPDVSMTLRTALPGAIVGAVGWTVLGALFRIYAVNASQFDAYGAVGAVLLFVTWLYFGAQVVLLGAAVNVVLVGDRDRQLQLGPLRTSGGDPTMTGSEGTDESPGDEPVDGDPSVENGEATDTTDEAPADETSEDVTDTTDEAPADETGEHGTGTVDGEPDELDELREEFERLEDDIEDRTVHRDEIERDLERYVRRRVRRGHARGWGPYLVLLYGTIMTLGAFYYLEGGWSILAMIVIWLSSLGLYVLMVLFGLTFSLVGTPGRLLDRVRDWRN